MNSLVKNKSFLFILHVIIGIISLTPFLAKVYGLLIIGIGVVSIVSNKNKNEEALLFAAYLASAEVFIRMTYGYILYETGKYGVALFLFMGLFYGSRKFKPNISFVFYLLLLLIGIVFTSVPDGESIRRAVVFNLSGPILLAICGFYCYQRNVGKQEIFNMLKMMVFPVISMCVFLYFRTPDIASIVFSGSANFDTSGGFGPNQVATSIGLGIACLSVLLVVRKTVTGYFFLDGIVLVYFIYRGLLTFSRGGLLAAIIAIVLFALFYVLYDVVRVKRLVPYVAVSGLILMGIWLYTSNVTGGMLDNRYAGRNAAGIKKKDLSSGRVAILEEQLKSFYENPIFGIGVGNGRFKRELEARAVTAASHNEIGRLIEEHGLIGISSLLLLVFLPLYMFTSVSKFNKAFLVFFAMFWFLTINHSAMRVALPSFVYGLALLKIRDE